MTILYYIDVIILGLLIGSFLNVVILRTPPRLFWQWKKDALEFLNLSSDTLGPKPYGIVVKHSFCPHCLKPIRWWENIPVFSFLFLRAKCSGCHAPISWQYPFVELFTGLCAFLSFYTYGFSSLTIIAFTLSCVLIVLSGIDFKEHLLPDDIVLPFLWIGLCLALMGYNFVTLQQSVSGAILGYTLLWSIYWIFKLFTGKEGMGYGDFKLLAMIGAFLGPQSVLLVLFLSSFLGSIIGIILLKRTKQQNPFAFGPALALATFCLLFFPQFKTFVFSFFH